MKNRNRQLSSPDRRKLGLKDSDKQSWTAFQQHFKSQLKTFLGHSPQRKHQTQNQNQTISQPIETIAQPIIQPIVQPTVQLNIPPKTSNILINDFQQNSQPIQQLPQPQQIISSPTVLIASPKLEQTVKKSPPRQQATQRSRQTSEPRLCYSIILDRTQPKSRERKKSPSPPQIQSARLPSQYQPSNHRQKSKESISEERQKHKLEVEMMQNTINAQLNLIQNLTDHNKALCDVWQVFDYQQLKGILMMLNKLLKRTASNEQQLLNNITQVISNLLLCLKQFLGVQDTLHEENSIDTFELSEEAESDWRSKQQFLSVQQERKEKSPLRSSRIQTKPSKDGQFNAIQSYQKKINALQAKLERLEAQKYNEIKQLKQQLKQVLESEQGLQQIIQKQREYEHLQEEEITALKCQLLTTQRQLNSLEITVHSIPEVKQDISESDSLIYDPESIKQVVYQLHQQVAQYQENCSVMQNQLKGVCFQNSQLNDILEEQKQQLSQNQQDFMTIMMSLNIKAIAGQQISAQIIEKMIALIHADSDNKKKLDQQNIELSFAYQENKKLLEANQKQKDEIQVLRQQQGGVEVNKNQQGQQVQKLQGSLDLQKGIILQQEQQIQQLNKKIEDVQNRSSDLEQMIKGREATVLSLQAQLAQQRELDETKASKSVDYSTQTWDEHKQIQFTQTTQDQDEAEQEQILKLKQMIDEKDSQLQKLQELQPQLEETTLKAYQNEKNLLQALQAEFLQAQNEISLQMSYLAQLNQQQAVEIQRYDQIEKERAIKDVQLQNYVDMLLKQKLDLETELVQIQHLDLIRQELEELQNQRLQVTNEIKLKREIVSEYDRSVGEGNMVQDLENSLKINLKRLNRNQLKSENLLQQVDIQIMKLKTKYSSDVEEILFIQDIETTIEDIKKTMIKAFEGLKLTQEDYERRIARETAKQIKLLKQSMGLMAQVRTFSEISDKYNEAQLTQQEQKRRIYMLEDQVKALKEALRIDRIIDDNHPQDFLKELIEAREVIIQLYESFVSQEIPIDKQVKFLLRRIKQLQEINGEKQLELNQLKQKVS